MREKNSFTLYPPSLLILVCIDKFLSCAFFLQKSNLRLMNIDGPEMTAKMMAWPVALNGSSNELFPGRMHPLQLFSSPNHGSGAPTALSGQIEQAGRISCNTCELDLTLIKVYIEALRRKKKRFSLFSVFLPVLTDPLSAFGLTTIQQSGTDQSWSVTVRSVLINLKSVPQTPFPFPDYPQPSWL